jgi:hypothetical protein
VGAEEALRISDRPVSQRFDYRKLHRASPRALQPEGAHNVDLCRRDSLGEDSPFGVRSN